MEADDCKLLSSSWKLSQGLLDGDGDVDSIGNYADDADGDHGYGDHVDGSGDGESQALETYKAVHRRFPDNVECLKFLVKL